MDNSRDQGELKKHDELRRKLIQTGWTTPVIMSVAIPVHAGTSITTTTLPPVTTPASVPTPPPTTTPVNASCMASATASQILLVNGGGNLPVSVTFTVKNTGDVPLNVKPGTGFTNVDPGFGPIGSAGFGAIDDPLMPGASDTFELTSLTVTNCGHVGTMDYRFRFFETECSVPILVTCTESN